MVSCFDRLYYSVAKKLQIPLLTCNTWVYYWNSLERGRKLLEDYLLNKTIVQVNAHESGGGPRDGLYDDIVFKNAKDGVLPKDICNILKGKFVIASKRKGKYLWLTLKQRVVSSALEPPKKKRRCKITKKKSSSLTNDTNNICFHFGMTGNVKVQYNNKLVEQNGYAREKSNTDVNVWPPKYSKLTMECDDGTKFAFTSPRRIARISLHKNIEEEEPVSKLGFDPLTSMIPLSQFKTGILKLSGNIKKNLLDQSFICGIGNWICDDVLFASGIHPSKECKHLRDDEIKQLHKAIKKIICTACKLNGDKDLFPKQWLFHYRWSNGKAGIQYPPLNKTIKFIKVAGRTTAVIPNMQKIGKKRSPS